MLNTLEPELPVVQLMIVRQYLEDSQHALDPLRKILWIQSRFDMPADIANAQELALVADGALTVDQLLSMLPDIGYGAIGLKPFNALAAELAAQTIEAKCVFGASFLVIDELNQASVQLLGVITQLIGHLDRERKICTRSFRILSCMLNQWVAYLYDLFKMIYLQPQDSLIDFAADQSQIVFSCLHTKNMMYQYRQEIQDFVQRRMSGLMNDVDLATELNSIPQYDIACTKFLLLGLQILARMLVAQDSRKTTKIEKLFQVSNILLDVRLTIAHGFVFTGPETLHTNLYLSSQAAKCLFAQGALGGLLKQNISKLVGKSEIEVRMHAIQQSVYHGTDYNGFPAHLWECEEPATIQKSDGIEEIEVEVVDTAAARLLNMQNMQNMEAAQQIRQHQAQEAIEFDATYVTQANLGVLPVAREQADYLCVQLEVKKRQKTEHPSLPRANATIPFTTGDDGKPLKM